MHVEKGEGILFHLHHGLIFNMYQYALINEMSLDEIKQNLGHNLTSKM